MSASLTIEEIAELAQVSRSTVSRVLNNHPSVRPAVRDRVLHIIDEYNYIPHAAARSLAANRTDNIGLIIPRSTAATLADPFLSRTIQSVAETSHSFGYFLLLSMIVSDMEQSFYHRTLRSRHFDGIIMLSSDIDDPILPLLIKDRAPFVLIGRHPYFQQIVSVDVENLAGAHQGVQHLINLGHRRIATITGQIQMEASLARRDGYKQALLEAGIPIRQELIVDGNYTQQGGHDAMMRLLALENRPTAVFAASDSMAIGAMGAIHEMQLRVPDDIAIVSFDDLPIAQYTNPRLTAVHQPTVELGAIAVQLLVDQIKSPGQAVSSVRLPTSLIIRDSCGAAAKTVKGDGALKLA